ncbi:rhodanese-like domain-containing protein [bacterium]|nr:MAG: rhodanese-like domain-containing protein [bacterium]
MLFNKLLFQCGIIAASSLLSGMTFNHFHDNGLDVIRKPAVKSSYQRMETQDPKKSKQLSIDEAYTLFKTKAAVFIDARQEVLYKMSHIKDAEWIYHQNAKENPRLKDYKKDQLLIIYCGGPKCEQAEHLVSELEELGFTGVFLFPGGMDEWRAAGYPIVERNKKE